MTSPVSWCHWHIGSSRTALPIRFAGRSGGPPVLLYACAPCREQRGLLPRWPPLPEAVTAPEPGDSHPRPRP
ncbi:hypothetical protein [Streptomyces sp. NPDC001717]|uniref:hypothetical protein n=1 Tax=Streptomyces sp. NPDC001717 TaxID=3364604 RepID=UPI0036CBD441